MVAALENDELVYEAPAIVGCQPPQHLLSKRMTTATGTGNVNNPLQELIQVNPSSIKSGSGPSELSMDRLVWGLDHHAGGQWRYAFNRAVIDQAALYGLLRQVRDLGMPLVSVNRVEPSQAGASDVKPPRPTL